MVARHIFMPDILINLIRDLKKLQLVLLFDTNVAQIVIGR